MLTRDGLLIRVFDPITLVQNMTRRCHSRPDDLIHYALPVGTDAEERYVKTRTRFLAGMIANSIQVVLDGSKKVTLRDELNKSSVVWPDLRSQCFIVNEIKYLTGEENNISDMDAYMNREFFLEMDKRLREHYIEAINEAVVTLLPWITPMPGLSWKSSIT